MKNSSYHKDFKLNGHAFNSVDELISKATEFSSELRVFLNEWFNENSFVEVHTSGSTGKPKRIKLQKKHMLASALATGDFFQLPEKTTALLCMPLNFIAGKMMLVRALTLGWYLDVVNPSSTPLKNLQNEYDFSAMVPLQLNNSLNEINRIKKLIVGGGAVSQELISKIQHLSTIIYATYGMTETITHIAVKRLNNLNIKLNDVYKTLPGVLVSVDERGCLRIHAPKISDEIVVTNDLVELISKTEFNWLGRYDSVINSGGIKLIPEQIEGKLSEIISQRFFLTGIQDAVLGKKMVLIVELENQNIEEFKDEFYEKLKEIQQFHKYEIPKEMYGLKKFVETETKKINRKETLQLLKNIY